MRPDSGPAGRGGLGPAAAGSAPEVPAPEVPAPEVSDSEHPGSVHSDAEHSGPDDAGHGDRDRRAEGRGRRGRRADRSGGRRAGRRGDASAEAGSADGAAEAPADPEQAARAICLRLLTGQPRTRAELAAALQKRGIPDEAAGAVLDRFGEVGLIDDAAFAEAWVSSRHRGRGLASRALRQELHRRGVAAETVQEALGTLDDETQEETARSLVRRRLTATRTLAPDVRTRRLLGMLARKGYPAGLAARVIREEIGAELSGPDGESLVQALESLADEPE
ncbi:MAG: recombinase RecX [Mycobacterium sp.]|nr:recombinase RecX [Mycobacterium sp.]